MERHQGQTIKKAALCALFAALTAAGAFVRIPFAFSAITLQFFFTALAGLLLGPWHGALSQLVYVALGLFGLPVFAAGGGITYLAVPSCGFVLGLPLAAFVIGAVSCPAALSPRVPYRRARCAARVIGAAAAGLAVLYLVGLSYMAVVLNAVRRLGMSAWQIAMAGMIPYLPGDALKIALCAILSFKLPRKI